MLGSAFRYHHQGSYPATTIKQLLPQSVTTLTKVHNIQKFPPPLGPILSGGNEEASQNLHRNGGLNLTGSHAFLHLRRMDRVVYKLIPENLKRQKLININSLNVKRQKHIILIRSFAVANAFDLIFRLRNNLKRKHLRDKMHLVISLKIPPSYQSLKSQ